MICIKEDIFLCEGIKIRRTEYLLNKYHTKQPGEHSNSHDMKNWRMSAKIRVCKYVMNRLNIQGANREICLNIVREVDLKTLHRKASCETIITCICFYVFKLNNPKRKITQYSVCKEYNVTEEIFSLVIVRLANHFQKNTPLIK